MVLFSGKPKSEREKVKIIVGLGNPGPKYKGNRHNAGFMVLERLAECFSAIFRRNLSLRAYLTKIEVDETKVILVKPRTFMNNSGLCLKRVLNHYGAVKENLLVVYDDIDLPFGLLRFKKKGSSAGHRGMESVISVIDTEEINRLRLGIGGAYSDLTEYVLSDFATGEQAQLKVMLEDAVAICINWVKCASIQVVNNNNKIGG
jgi:PTH1 family peptidyl-tRNA hydrolase